MHMFRGERGNFRFVSENISAAAREFAIFYHLSLLTRLALAC